MINFVRNKLILLFLLLPFSAYSATYAWDKNSNIIGHLQTIKLKKSQNFAQIAEKYGVAFNNLVDANPKIDPWAPPKGAELIIPTQFILPAGPRTGIVINVAEYRLYYFDEKKQQIHTYPTGIGRVEWPTPLGNARIMNKVANPSWTVPESILAEAMEKNIPITPVVPPGPDNPLGDHALRLSMPSILIHGTNNPAGVGRRVTHGCMRLYPQDVAQLFSMIQPGVAVRIVHEPVKAAWQGYKLFVEMHQPLPEYAVATSKYMEHVARVIGNDPKAAKLNLDWGWLSSMAKTANGLPSVVAYSGLKSFSDVRKRVVGGLN